MTQQIIAMGGGGFSTQSEPGLDEYILRQSARAHPNIGFIGTASGDSDNYLLRFYARFSKLDCKPSHLALFRRTPDVEQWIREQDIIFVGGGNTKSMLALWIEWDLPKHLRTALDQGVVLAGISAGAICWFESGVTDSFASQLRPLQGLGLLQGSCCPHYSGEADRKPAYRTMIENGEIDPGIAIDDGVCVHFVDGRPHKVVRGDQGVDAYSVTLHEGKLQEVPLADVERLNIAT